MEDRALMNYVEDKQNSEFYPTPAYLARKMFDKVDWNFVQTVLEPSAGKGDILRELARILHCKERRTFDIDCIELDSNLRSILKYAFSEEALDKLRERKATIIKSRGKYGEQEWSTRKYKFYDDADGQYHYFPNNEQEQLACLDNEMNCFFHNELHVVHDNFLTYTPYKQYDLIVMNPPFSEGDRHLLKALEMQKNGGSIVCLLNAETIRNPYTATRKNLVKLLNDYHAEIEYIDNAFLSAERKTDVETALIRIDIPRTENESSIFEKMAKAKQYEEPSPQDQMELEVTDFIQAIVNRYKVEIESGIELIRTYTRMLPYLRSSVDPDDKYRYDKPIITLTDGNSHDMTINSYVKKVRLKYWQGLLTNHKFIGRLTTKLQQKYRERVSSYADYDFSEFNIYTLLSEMNAQIKSGIENEILVMYDRLTEEHAYYPECKKNRHLYDGWKTNKAWKLGKKSIIPCYGVFDSWSGQPRTYEAYSVLSDIERVLNFFDGNMTADVNLQRELESCFNNGITKNIHCKFFDVTFYKKGTVHITFTCPELIDRYNIYVAQNRKWLPPSYGKKQYADMTADERAVIDSFQGEKSYGIVMSCPDNYLKSPIAGTQHFLAIAE